MVMKDRKERDKTECVAIKNPHRTGYDVQHHNDMQNLFAFPYCLFSGFAQKL
jgi:hypothetical protein